jgi:RHS repeat-associated protein
MQETIKGDGAATNVTTYGYNPDGQIAQITDPMGQTFEYSYDADNRLSSILMTDTEQNETTKEIEYTWDSNSKTETYQISIGNDQVAIKCNAYGLLESVDGVLSGDDANADRVSYAYDDDYKLAGVGYYIYDAQQSQYVLWTTSYAYDAFGRLETITDRLGRESAYAYNDDFSLKSLTLPNGTVTSYTYDDLRRLVSIATTGLSANDIIAKFTYQYNDLGLRDKVSMADGRMTEWAYDDVGRLIQEHFKKPDGTTLLRYLYAYDAAGNRTSKKTDYDDDDGAYAATATYTNNAYNQLTGVSGNPGRGNKVNVTGTIPTAWTLADGDVKVTPNSGSAVDAEIRGRFFIARNVPLSDSATNSIVASTTATTLAGNAPSSDTVQNVALDQSLDVAYTYDANGNLVAKSEEGGSILWTYTYSVDDWLIKVEGPAGFVEQYSYDPIGRKYKIETTENQQTTTRYLVYDGGSVVLEIDSAMELSKEFVRGSSLGGGIGGLLYTRDSSGGMGYFHYDAQGNVVSVTDEAREELAYYEYDACGNLLTECGGLSNEFKFSTKQASLGTNLVDFGYRWYDAQTGRWTQRDPGDYQDSGNLYLYALNSPLFLYDPWGDVIRVYKEAGTEGWTEAGTAKTKEDIDALEANAKRGDVNCVFRDLYKIVLTVCGKNLLVGLAESEKVVEIYVYTTREIGGPPVTTGANREKALPKGQKVTLPGGGEVTGTGEGTDCTIKYENYTTRTDDDFTAYPDEQLVHELQRAWDTVMGTYDMTVVKGLRKETCRAVCKMNEYIREKEGQGTTRQRKKYFGKEVHE